MYSLGTLDYPIRSSSDTAYHLTLSNWRHHTELHPWWVKSYCSFTQEVLPATKNCRL